MLTETYWKGILINSPIHFELGDINTLAEYLTEVSNGSKPNVSGSLPLLEDCKKAATDYADKKGGGNYGEIFRAYQEGINWALNWVSKRQ